MSVGNKRFYERFFFGEFCPIFIIYQTNFATNGAQSQIGIVLSEQDSVLGARGEHTIWLIYPLHHQVIYQDSDVCFVTLQDNLFEPVQLAVGIDTRHQTLRRSLLITRSAVDLTCEVESIHQLGLQRVAELCGWEVVVLYGVTWAIDVCLLQTLDLSQSLELNLLWQRR